MAKAMPASARTLRAGRERGTEVPSPFSACGADETDVKIGVSEAVGNAVIHAYRDGGGGPIRVSGALYDDKLVIVVADEGVGMSPDPGSPGLGLGLPLIGNVTEDMHVTAGPRGTTISMSFPASDGPAS